MYYLLLLDTYGVGWALVFVGFLEMIGLAWIYGTDRLIFDIKSMTGIRLTILWPILWKIVCPVLLLFTVAMSLVYYSPLHYDKFVFPNFVEFTVKILK